MMFLYTLLLAVTFLTSMQERFREYRMQLNAYALYERHAYPEAEQAYEELHTPVHSQKEINRTTFNLACTLYMQGKFQEAADLFAQSAKTGSKYSEIRQSAIYNEGDALAMKAIGSNGKAQKTLFFRQSLNRFKTVLLTDPGDGEAKINYEIVRRFLKEQETPEQNTAPPPSPGLKNNVANRLLDNAQQDESSIMRRAPRTAPSAAHGSKNNKDW